MNSKHRNTDYVSDPLIGQTADLAPRPTDQAAVARLLRECGRDDAGELALMLGVAS